MTEFRSRYPGTSPFDDSPDDVSRFFGRDAEAEDLYLRVLSVPLLVQFGASGLGKTSLLQAGLFPRLRRKPFLPVMVRLNAAEDSLIESVVRSMRKSCDIEGLDFAPGDTSGLWQFLSTTTIFRDDLLLTPVLVFDQFEEVFTLRDAEFRASLAAELGALASAQSTRKHGVKIVISLREDYVGALEEFSAAIPGLFHERLRLEPFSERAAREAVTCPALLEDRPGEEPFGSPRFELERPALDALIQYLRGRSGVIEPIQLQLLCRHAESIARGKPRAGNDPGRLTPGDFRGRQSFGSVLENFYRDTLRRISPHAQRANAARLCEEGLLDGDGHRLMLEERQVLREFDVRPETLLVLTQEKLIRRERRLESVFYEISHDRLAESIFNARRVRLPRNVRQALWIAGIAALIVVGALVWFSARVSRARDRGEQLIAFLIGEQFLGEVRDMGSSTLLQQVQEEVERSGGAENRPPLLAGMVLRNQGDVKRLQGDIAAAASLYEQAVDAFGSDAADADSLREVARAHERLSTAWSDRRALASALSQSETAVATWRRVVASAHDPEARADDCVSLADSLILTGVLRDRLGDGQRALADADSAVEIISGMLFGGGETCGPAPSRAEPYPDPRALQVLSRAALVRAVVLDTTEDYEGAATLAREANALRPSSTSARKYSLEALAWRAYKGGTENPQSALDDYRQVLAEAEELRRWDPNNRLWRRERAVSLELVGRGIALCHRNGRCDPMPALEDAEAMGLEAIATLRSLAQQDPNNVSLHADLFWALLDQADILGVAQRQHERLEILEQAEQSHAKLQTDPESRAMLGYLLQHQTLVHQALGRGPEAAEALRKSIAVWEALTAEHPKHPIYAIALLSSRLLESAGAASEQISVLNARIHELTQKPQEESDRLRERQTARLQQGAGRAQANDHAGALSDFNAAAADARAYIRLRPGDWLGYFAFHVTSNRMLDSRLSLKQPGDEGAARNAAVQSAQIAAWLAPDEGKRTTNDALLKARYAFGNWLYHAGRLEEALAMSAEEVAVAEALMHDDPLNADYQARLGQAKCELGLVRRDLKQDGWEEAVRSGIIQIQKATTLQPANAAHWTALGKWRRYLGDKLIEDGRKKEGAEQHALALASSRKVPQ